MMNDINTQPVAATISSKRTFSVVWIIPTLAIIIGLWMVYNQFQSEGPMIEVTFSSAAGIDVKKTQIKVREVNIGEVTNVSLLDNLEGVKVSIRINKKAENLLNSNTQFWVVSPKITNNGISGLNTLLSGPYIEMSPGNGGEPVREFIGLEDAPITPNGTPGLRLTLNSDKEFAYQAGDPIIYKGLTVGQIEEVSFNFDNRVVYYNAFVEAPYHQLITDTTIFWNASGLKFQLSTEGVTVESSSLDTLLTNGVTFGVPEGSPQGNIVSDNTRFDVYSSYEQATTPNYVKTTKYLLLISDSVRGLSAGAPVEYRGIEIGEVVSVNYTDSSFSRGLSSEYNIPVLIEFAPGKIGLPDTDEGLADMDTQMKRWIEGGLKSSLKTGNLLTGKLFIDLQHFPKESIKQVKTLMGYPVIPTTVDSLALLSKKTADLLDKLNRLPLNDLIREFKTTMQEFKDTAESVNKTSKDVSEFLSQAEKETLFKQLNETLASFEVLAESYSKGSMPHEQVMSVIDNFNHRLQQLQPILLQLDQKPNSLIFSNEKGANIQPQAQSSQGNK